MIKPIKIAVLIDDEIIDQRMYKRVLRKSGLIEEVITFSLATEAIDYFRQNPDFRADVIFLDINMPKMDGFEFLESVTRDFGSSFAKVIVAMLTTSLNTNDEERARQFEPVRLFINKPLKVDHIHQVASLLTNELDG